MRGILARERGSARMPGSSQSKGRRLGVALGPRGARRRPSSRRLGCEAGARARLAAHALLGRVGNRHGGDEALRVRLLGCTQDLPGRTLLDDLPVVHHDDPVGERVDDREVVADEQAREAEVALQAAQQFEDRGLHRHVEGRCRLVGDQQLRLEREGACDAHALLLSAGQLVRVAVAVRAGQLDGIEQLLHPLVQVSALAPRPRAACGSPIDCADRQARVERRRRVLEDDADVLVHLVQQAAVGLRDVVADDRRAAVGDRQQADGGAADGGLARAGLADEAGDLAGEDREGRVLDGAERRDAAALGVLDRDVLERRARERRRPSRRSASSRAATSARRICRRVAGQRGRRVDRLTRRPRRCAARRPAAAACTDAAGRRRRPSTVPRSTISPLRITTMSSARSATTPMSWVMSRMAESRRWRRSRMRSRISACTVTSSAVVGSSAMSSYGSHEIDWAIMAR